MKVKNILLVAVLTLLLGQISLHANETENLATAKANLIERISEIVNNAPVDLISYDYSNELIISFWVNENGRLASVQVKGQNETLVQYVKLRLEQNLFSIDPVLGNSKYKIPVSYRIQKR